MLPSPGAQPGLVVLAVGEREAVVAEVAEVENVEDTEKDLLVVAMDVEVVAVREAVVEAVAAEDPEELLAELLEECEADAAVPVVRVRVLPLHFNSRQLTNCVTVLVISLSCVAVCVHPHWCGVKVVSFSSPGIIRSLLDSLGPIKVCCKIEI